MRSENKRMFLAVACVFVGAALGAFFLSGGRLVLPGPGGGEDRDRGGSYSGSPQGHQERGPDASGEPGQLAAEQALTLARGAVVRITFQYECGHSETVSEPVADRLKGASREVLASAYPGCEVASFSANLVELTERLPGMAPSCSSNSFIGAQGDRVAVFYGTPARPCRVKQVTDISISSLPPQEASDVRNGIPVAGEDEILAVLEGLGER